MGPYAPSWDPYGLHMGPYGAHMGRMWAHMDRIDEFTYFFAWVTRAVPVYFETTDTKRTLPLNLFRQHCEKDVFSLKIHRFRIHIGEKL